MKTITGDNPAFQGDMMIMRCDKLPADAVRQQGNIVAHSETGHHHIVHGAEVFTVPDDSMVMFLRLPKKTAKVEHLRAFDTHETLRLLGDTPGTVWKINRQREYVPDGWRRVED